MRLDLFQRLLSVPTETGDESLMVVFIEEHIKSRGVARCGHAFTDAHNNVYVVKGTPRYFPCLAAHIDTVHPVGMDVSVVQEGDIFVGYNRKGKRAGIGADDKTGIMVCLEALERLDNVACMFFASEETGCVGAFNSSPEFFDNVGYMLEWDAPGSDLFSYTSAGVRLFENEGEFIRRALPSLQRRNMLWQKHPYTDVMAIRKMHPISCMNISSGYYNWHQKCEYARVSHVRAAVDLALELVQSLECNRYVFPVRHRDAQQPLVEVGPLVVNDHALLEQAVA